MVEDNSISKYKEKYELDIRSMIEDFKGYIYKIIENNSKGQLSYEDKEEIISDVFLTVWHNKKKIDETKPLKNYIVGITKNLIKNKLRSKKYDTNLINLDEQEIEYLDNLDIICEEKQIAEVIKEELNNMKKEEYQVFAKYYYASKSIKEIAKELNLSESNVKVKLHRIRKRLSKELQKRGYTYKIISVILVLFLITGVVFAKQIVTSIKNLFEPEKQEQAKQVKWGRHKISMTDDVETIKENMLQYDDNIYILRIEDYETYKEKAKRLSIDIEENEYNHINKDTFEKIDYEVIIVAFINHQPIQLNNVLPYDSRLVLEFTYRDDITENENIMCFCASVPKSLSKDKIEIECKKSELEQMPEGALQFRISPFYIENIDEFDKEENLTYDEEQDIYYIKGINKDNYNKLAERLGIITQNAITDEYLVDKNSVIVVFKKTSNKIKLARFIGAETELGQNKTMIESIVLEETDEKYGKGIGGAIIILKNVSNAEDYGIIMK